MTDYEGKRPRGIPHWLVGVGLVLLLAATSEAQEAQSLVVGTRQAAPFSFRTDDGPWRGISIELWQGIAQDLDLPSVNRLASVRGSTGEGYLRGQRLPYATFDSAMDALQALADQGVRAVVYDAPILRYLTLTAFEDSVTVLPVTFEQPDYAIALPVDSSV